MEAIWTTGLKTTECFILDDFDRVDASVQREILSSLPGIGVRNRFLILCDRVGLAQDIASDIEKVVSATVKFPAQSSDVYQAIAREGGVSEEYVASISNSAAEIELKNLRVYKRAVAKIVSLNNELLTYGSDESRYFMGNVAKSIIFCHACQVDFKTPEDLWGRLDHQGYYSFFDEGDAEEDDDGAEKKLLDSYDSQTVFSLASVLSPQLVEFCFDYRVSAKDAAASVVKNIPDSSLLDKLRGYHFVSSEREFESLAQDLESRVVNPLPGEDIVTWARYADFYLYLIENYVLDKVLDDELFKIHSVISGFDFLLHERDEAFMFFDRWEVSNSTQFPYAEFKARKDRLEKDARDSFLITSAKEVRDGKKSFSDFSQELLKDFSHQFLFGDEFSVIMSEAVERMSPIDVIMLNGFLKERYKAVNISDFLNDFDGIELIYSNVYSYEGGLRPSRKKGAVFHLKKTLGEILTERYNKPLP